MSDTREEYKATWANWRDRVNHPYSEGPPYFGTQHCLMYSDRKPKPIPHRKRINRLRAYRVLRKRPWFVASTCDGTLTQHELMESVRSGSWLDHGSWTQRNVGPSYTTEYDGYTPPPRILLCYNCHQPVRENELGYYSAGNGIGCHVPPHPCGEATTVHGPGDNVEYNLPREP